MFQPACKAVDRADIKSLRILIIISNASFQFRICVVQRLRHCAGFGDRGHKIEVTNYIDLSGLLISPGSLTKCRLLFDVARKSVYGHRVKFVDPRETSQILQSL